MRKIISALLLTIAAASSVHAAAPNLLTYQGRLKDSGQAVTGIRSVEIYLCDALTSGNCHTTGAQDVTVSNGLFRSTFTVPSAADFGAGDWYLELWVAGTRLLPRERLSSSAYSLVAASAAWAGGADWSTITNKPSLTAQGNTFNGASQLVQLGADGKLPALDGSALTGVTASSVTKAANLGGGTVGAVPYQSAADTTAMLAAGTAGYVLTGAGAAAPVWTQAINTNVASAIVKRDASGNFTAGTITAALIGNAATASALSANPANCSAGYAPAGIAADGTAEGCFEIGGAGSALDADKLDNLDSLDFVRGTGNVSEIVTGAKTFTSSVTVIGSAFSIGDSTFVVKEGNIGIGVASPQGMFQVGGGTLTVLANGNVGIGTTNPLNRLSVHGSILATRYPGEWNSESFYNAPGIFLIPTSQDIALLLNKPVSGGTGQSISIVLSADESVNPGSKIQFTRTGNWDQGDLSFWTAPVHSGYGDYTTEKMRILSGGNVGIGTAAPGYKLDVQGGNINASGGFCIAGDCKSSWASVSPGDNLGSHVATATLRMGAYGVNTSSSVSAAHYQINGSTVLAVLQGTGSFAVGDEAGRVNTATYNAFLGSRAGYVNTTGNYNAFAGSYAGYANTAGYYNTFVGSLAGYANTDGDYNSFIGGNAGFSNTTAGANSFVGYHAGYTNTVGQYNVFFGAWAGLYNTTGWANSFVGMDAGQSNTTGVFNSLVGNKAGYYNQTGSANAIFGGYAGGYGAGVVNSFSSSTIMGYKAGYGLSTGSDNILLGFQAGDSLTTGTRNIIIGYDQDVSSGPATSNTLNIGGAIYGDLSSGNVGIGTTNPVAKLQVAGTAIIQGGMSVNTSNPPGTSLDIYGSQARIYSAGSAVNFGIHNTAGRDWRIESFDNSGLFGAPVGALAFHNNTDNVWAMTILPSGNVGIGTLAPSTRLDVQGGSINASGGLCIAGDCKSSWASVSTGDNLGNHVATTTLRMGAYGVNTSSDISAAHFQINGSTVLAILSGADSLAVGNHTGRINTGAGNSFVGTRAGYANTTGTGNTFLGVDAGRTNTTANGGTFVGIEAGYANTTGAPNTFVGDQAGRSNTTGNYNVFMGYQAGYNNTIGTSNSFIGMYTGISNTTGGGNSVFGFQAAQQNQTGSANAIFGGYAGGPGSGAPNSFSSSTLMGYKAGYALSTGSDNILLGFQAGDSLTTGSRNIIIGYDQDASSGPATSNTLNIGGAIHGNLSTGNIGIGSANPGSKLEVNGDAKVTGNVLMGLNYQVYEVGEATVAFRVGCGAGYAVVSGGCGGEANITSFYASYPSVEIDDAPTAGTPISDGATVAHSWTCRQGLYLAKAFAVCARIGN